MNGYSGGTNPLNTGIEVFSYARIGASYIGGAIQIPVSGVRIAEDGTLEDNAWSRIAHTDGTITGLTVSCNTMGSAQTVSIKVNASSTDIITLSTSGGPSLVYPGGILIDPTSTAREGNIRNLNIPFVVGDKIAPFFSGLTGTLTEIQVQLTIQFRI